MRSHQGPPVVGPTDPDNPSLTLSEAHRIAHDAEHDLIHAVAEADDRTDPRPPGAAVALKMRYVKT
jgi:hypothetical protein